MKSSDDEFDKPFSTHQKTPSNRILAGFRDSAQQHAIKKLGLDSKEDAFE